MNEAVFQEQHGTEEEIYAAARDTAAEFLENFDEAMAEEEEWRQSQQAEKDEREQADTTEDPAATQAQEREVTDQWTDTGAMHPLVLPGVLSPGCFPAFALSSAHLCSSQLQCYLFHTDVFTVLVRYSPWIASCTVDPGPCEQLQ